MADLPRPWASYAHFQTRLSRSSSLDDRVWGLEGALNVILDPDFSSELSGDREFRRAAASSSRKRRDHLSRFLVMPDDEFDPPDGKDMLAQLAAREALNALGGGLGQQDLQLLSVIAHGYDYQSAAHILGRPATSLRNRMHRLRNRFAYLKP